MVHGFLTSQNYQIFTVHRIEQREFKSAKSFFLSLLVFEIGAFNFLIFNSVQQQCNDLC
jgi:hypothetical protein